MYEQDMEGRVLAADMDLKVVLTEMVLVAFKATWQGHISHVSVLNRRIFSPRGHLLVSGDLLLSYWLLLGATGVKG